MVNGQSTTEEWKCQKWRSSNYSRCVEKGQRTKRFFKGNFCRSFILFRSTAIFLNPYAYYEPSINSFARSNSFIHWTDRANTEHPEPFSQFNWKPQPFVTFLIQPHCSYWAGNLHEHFFLAFSSLFFLSSNSFCNISRKCENPISKWTAAFRKCDAIYIVNS